MNFFDAASKIEEQGYLYYVKLAEETESKEVAGIFLSLAKEEKKHREVFEALKNSLPARTSGMFKTPDDSPDAENMFRSLTENFPESSYSSFTNVEAFDIALGLEQMSITTYEKALKETKNHAEKSALTQIIAEEKKHVWLVNSLKDFLHNPEAWPQNAEWYQAEVS